MCPGDSHQLTPSLSPIAPSNDGVSDEISHNLTSIASRLQEINWHAFPTEAETDSINMAIATKMQFKTSFGRKLNGNEGEECTMCTRCTITGMKNLAISTRKTKSTERNQWETAIHPPTPFEQCYFCSGVNLHGHFHRSAFETSSSLLDFFEIIHSKFSFRCNRFTPRLATQQQQSTEPHHISHINFILIYSIGMLNNKSYCWELCLD